jgi:hypothetical protein
VREDFGRVDESERNDGADATCTERVTRRRGKGTGNGRGKREPFLLFVCLRNGERGVT